MEERSTEILRWESYWRRTPLPQDDKSIDDDRLET
jgi:hypothetical protein